MLADGFPNWVLSQLFQVFVAGGDRLAQCLDGGVSELVLLGSVLGRERVFAAGHQIDAPDDLLSQFVELVRILGPELLVLPGCGKRVGRSAQFTLNSSDVGIVAAEELAILHYLWGS